jgi:hypothetical protein
MEAATDAEPAERFGRSANAVRVMQWRLARGFVS